MFGSLEIFVIKKIDSYNFKGKEGKELEDFCKSQTQDSEVLIIFIFLQRNLGPVLAFESNIGDLASILKVEKRPVYSIQRRV